jgi:mono/diheme cytochrome c family protein
MLRFSRRLVPGLALPVVAWLCASAAISQASAADVAADSFAAQVAPLLAKYCTACHGNDAPEGDLSLARFANQAEALEADEIWSKVHDNLSQGTMPPDGEDQPTPEERAQLIAWIESQLPSFNCQGPRDPGRVTLRRLNRAQYNRTIRDLLGVDFQPANDFPADDVGYGFDNIGDVLSLPPILLEKYLAAAQQIVERTIATDDPRLPHSYHYEAVTLAATPGRSRPLEKNRVLFYVGAVYVDQPVQVEGDYIIRVRAAATQAGSEPAMLGIRVDGDQHLAAYVLAPVKEPRTYEVRVPLQAGQRRIAAAFLNDHSEPPGKDAKARIKDRNLFVEWIEVEGPLDLSPTPKPESHRRLVIAEPVRTAEQPRGARSDVERAGREVLARIAQRAYRRPIPAEELVRLTALAMQAFDEGASYEESLQIGLMGVLVSPHFLFMIEDPTAATPMADGSQRARITPWELATRLSYFVWGTMPDEELFARAADGNLADDDVLSGQLRRMLADPKSVALVDDFAMQWLHLRLLDTAAPDPERFPRFAELRGAMRRETELFFTDLIQSDRSVLDLLDGDYSFVNGPLAEYYGLPFVTGDHFRRITWPVGSPRGGVLTHASVLTVTSNPTRTSPVKRGKWVLEQMLGAPPPPPPPNVPELEEGGAALTGTLRQRMEQHRANPACAQCHARMDPLGFGLENFDAVGAWRTRENEALIDASGELPDGATFDGPAGLRQVLRQKQDEFCRCLAEKLLTYALGRGLETADRCTVEDILTGLQTGGYKFSALAEGIVESDAFRLRTFTGENP